jgi:hypothetical protein
MAVLADLGAVDRRVDSKPGTFTPIGVMIHHTAFANTGPIPALKTVREGREATATSPKLRPPLCNVLIGRDASVHVIADAMARDSGTGDPCVLKAFKAHQPLPKPDDEDPFNDKNADHFTDGTPLFYDIEVENTGVGEPYPDAQVQITARVAAAICRANGFAADRVLCHKEWTKRKIDWSCMSGDETRALVARALEEDDMPSAQEVARATVDLLNDEGSAIGTKGFGLTVQLLAQLSRENSLKLDQILARPPGGTVDVSALASSLAAELGDDLARQLGETLVRNSGGGG